MPASVLLAASELVGLPLDEVIAIAKRLLPAEPYPAFTPRTAGSARALWTRLRRGLREGIFCEEGEFVPGVSCYAVALPCDDLGETVALAISFDSARPERERRPLRPARSLHRAPPRAEAEAR